MNAQELAGQFAQQGAQLGQSQSQIGMQGAQAAGQLGLQGNQQALAASTAAGQLGMDIGQMGVQGGQAVGNLGMNLGQLGQSGAEAQGQLGLQYGQLAQQDAAFLSDLGSQQAALGQGIGNIATQYGSLGANLAQQGAQQANLGGMAQNFNIGDMQALTAAGGMQQAQNQAVLDAVRQTNVARQAQPYQQYGFLSDIYAGTPSSSSTMQTTSSPNVSPIQTAVGLGIQGLAAASGASRMGLIG
jgi:hypothetical protein